MTLFKKKPSVKMTLDDFGGTDCTSRLGSRVKNAVYMRNWRITDDGKLKKRNGFERVAETADGHGLYCGRVGGAVYYVYQTGTVITAYDVDGGEKKELDTGESTERSCFMFGGLLYIVGGEELLTFDGHSISVCEPYIPKVAVTAPNEGGGIVLEDLNLLSPYARISYSPNGISSQFVLPDEALSVVGVIENGLALPSDNYSYNKATHTLTIMHIPSSLTPDSLEVTFSLTDPNFPDRSLLRKRSFCPFGSRTDSALFVYGGDNVIYYSDVTDKGADCTYFPVNNFIRVGDGTPVTALVRHYSTLAVFTENDAWYISPSSVADGDYSKTAYPIFPLNGKIGCIRNGGVLVNSSPLTVKDDGVYIWNSTNVRDEKNAQLISSPVSRLLPREFLSNCTVFDAEGLGEVWLVYGNTVCVYNYRRSAWYFYDGINAEKLYECDGVVYFSNEKGLYRFSESVYTDDGEAYNAVWESSFADFGVTGKKNVYRLLTSLIPDAHTDVKITVSPNVGAGKTCGEDGCYRCEIFDFFAMDFRKFSFECESRPSSVERRVTLRGIDSVKLKIENGERDGRCTVNEIVLFAST